MLILHSKLSAHSTMTLTAPLLTQIFKQLCFSKILVPFNLSTLVPTRGALSETLKPRTDFIIIKAMSVCFSSTPYRTNLKMIFSGIISLTPKI